MSGTATARKQSVVEAVQTAGDLTLLDDGNIVRDMHAPQLKREKSAYREWQSSIEVVKEHPGLRSERTGLKSGRVGQQSTAGRSSRGATEAEDAAAKKVQRMMRGRQARREVSAIRQTVEPSVRAQKLSTYREEMRRRRNSKPPPPGVAGAAHASGEAAAGAAALERQPSRSVADFGDSTVRPLPFEARLPPPMLPTSSRIGHLISPRTARKHAGLPPPEDDPEGGRSDSAAAGARHHPAAARRRRLLACWGAYVTAPLMLAALAYAVVDFHNGGPAGVGRRDAVLTIQVVVIAALLLIVMCQAGE